MIWLALLALTLAQDPAPAEEPKWIEFDSAALIVNGDIITRVDVLSALRRLPPSENKADQARKSDEIVTQKVRELLEVQAGQVMGYDEKMVERFVQNQLERQREAAGSVTRLASELQSRNLDSFTHKDEIRTQVYGMLWQRSQTGIDAAPKGRIAADRYVRPGRLYFEFKDQEALFASDSLVTVQDFGLKIGNSADEVRAVLQQLRERVQAGADFDEETARLGAQDAKANPMVDRPQSEFRSVPSVARFLQSAEPGDVSEVLEITKGGALVGYRLVYLVERKPRPVPVFADQELQTRLREAVERSLDEVRIDAGLERLRRAAYVWPPELLGRRSTIEN